jgi:hypothetical protein
MILAARPGPAMTVWGRAAAGDVQQGHRERQSPLQETADEHKMRPLKRQYWSRQDLWSK